MNTPDTTPTAQAAGFGLRSHLKLRFDPTTSTDPELVAVFADQTARTIWLLWRQGHIVSQFFNEVVLDAAKLLREAKPTTADELAKCFFRKGYSDIRGCDLEDWCRAALQFFTGERAVTFEVIQNTERSGSATP